MRTALALALAGAVLSPAAAQALAPGTADEGAFIANGAVNAIARANGTTYIGGDFTNLRAQAGGAAFLGATDGKRVLPRLDLGGVGEHVIASAPDGAGGLFIGGAFSEVGGVPRNRIAHILPDGTVDPAFNPNANGIVRALAVSGGAVYVGGDFNGADSIGGEDRDYIAKLSATSGNAFSAWNPAADDDVRALAISGSELYVGGDFGNIGGENRENIAKLSATSGNAFSTWNPNATGTGAIVMALAVSGSNVYAGGVFTNIGGEARDNIAKLSATSGNAFTGFDPDANGAVRVLTADATSVYAGGFFNGADSIGGEDRDFLAKLSATSGNAFSAFNPDPSDDVESLLLSGSTLYVGGNFGTIAGVPRSKVARLSTSSGDAFASFNAGGIDGPVESLALAGSRLFVGGEYTSVNGTGRNRIAALDDDGVPTAWNPSATGGATPAVFALAATDTEVYAAGRFANIGGLPRDNIAKLSPASGNAFSGFDPDANNAIEALVLSGSDLFVGGNFTQIGGASRNFLAKLSATSGNAFSTWNPSPNSNVRALAVADGAVYVGGPFDTTGGGTIGGQPRDHLAKLSATSGNAFSLWNPAVNGSDVVDIAVSGSEVFVGGFFTNVGGQARSHIAKLSATSGNAFSTWDPSASGQVNALALSGTAVYAGGLFNNIGGLGRNRLAALSTGSGDAFTTFDPNMDNTVVALVAEGDALYAGGIFGSVGGAFHQGFAQFTSAP